MSRFNIGTTLDKTSIFKMYRNLKRSDLEAGLGTSIAPYNNDIVLIKQNFTQIKKFI